MKILKEKEIFRYIDPTVSTKIAITLLYLYFALTLVVLTSSLFELNLLLDFKNGKTISDAVINSNDLRQYYLGSALSILFILTGIFYLNWLYRAISNARSFEPTGVTFTPGWSVAWYFVPIILLYGPYQDMVKLSKISKKPHSWFTQKTALLIKLWWTFWLVSNIIFYIVSKMMTIERQFTIDFYIGISETYIFACLISILCTGCLILIIKSVNRNQIHTYKKIYLSSSFEKLLYVDT